MTDNESTRREQILDAALRVFARRGYDKATIKEIASEASVKSPALLYWYFPSKEELLKAVLAKLMPFLPEIDTPEALMELPPEEIFGRIGRFLFGAMNSPVMARLFKIFFSEALRTPEVIDHIAEIGPLRVLNFMTAYLQHQMDTGQMRQHDPRASARAFMGMLMIYIVSREIVPSLGKDIPESDAYLQEVITLFLQGLRPN
jgi:TetR/AcrR family transcriptional regulator, regulator of autoinduction and epiphytic fitness